LNINKLNSGKFHQNKVEFLGFQYFGGVFTISEEKIEEFKNKIIKITHLTKNKTTKAIIKQLNNKILGFGHYYKFVYYKQDFENLDAFVRMRLRRYLSRNKDNKNKQGNLLLTNEVLKNMGLKSLIDIYTKYASKKRFILKKSIKKKNKNGNKLLPVIQLKSFKQVDSTLLLAIFKELKEITKNINYLKNKISKIEKKWKS
jgi:5-carboxymethyl-2-hydroxymuconate isomerase